MKRRIIAILMILFCISVSICNAYGEKLRSILTPRVNYCNILYSPDGYVLPEETIRTNGGTHILLIRKSEKFPERGYEAVRKDCTLTGQDDGMVFIEMEDTLAWDEKVITKSDRPVYDGNKVSVES